ncbi:Apo-citrate lyase phosphoribosyl-dephospho-CoA transferase [Alkaliphilus metalliredigens QYMF]|uniref:citrate lyase holo-[acyl-carrier protein] synthase n=1 Tax=Alkaliphilus metalliredigens (strain QYMF) TaxID=293826 RepID=A6TT42_ALKMQ|nr:citrate lyase holo-[acyl-carrier protein] synthase [Alkaliphilus metalliredigens]ABR49360.1 Apo-citrate lyase phosphoribosyl-dephospho-CoA transferase [Alkaliphilus metalliredigens QYMF]
MKQDLLEKVLEAKEERATYQKQLIDNYQLPLVSLTLNLPGGYFQYTGWENVMEKAVIAIDKAFDNDVMFKDTRVGKWGPEGFWVIDQLLENVKIGTIRIEDIHPLGRLFDIDVINKQGSSISRRDFHIKARKCMICNHDALDCYVGKKHTGEELKLKIDEMIDKGLEKGW